MFNLINQNDASTSLQIALSAQHDSASMKVVALMTIFFLPGTFFATLFAVPTLTWSEDVVVSSRFWIYWAFTLPCTLLLVALYKGWGWGWGLVPWHQKGSVCTEVEIPCQCNELHRKRVK